MNTYLLPPAKRLISLRIIFAGLLLGQLAFLFVVLFGPLQYAAQQPGIRTLLMWVDVGMLAMLPITYGIRRLIFRMARTPQGVAIGAYSTGNLIFWAGCEGVTFSSLVFTMLSGSMIPEMLIVVVAMCSQIATYPKAAGVNLT